MYPIILKSKRGILKHINSLDNSLKERENSTKQLDVTRYEMLMGIVGLCKVENDEEIKTTILVAKKYPFVCTCLQRSIDLNPAQKDLVLKVAELLVSIEECDSRAEFWVEKAGKLLPGSPAVFNLKVSLQFCSTWI